LKKQIYSLIFIIIMLAAVSTISSCRENKGGSGFYGKYINLNDSDDYIDFISRDRLSVGKSEDFYSVNETDDGFVVSAVISSENKQFTADSERTVLMLDENGEIKYYAKNGKETPEKAIELEIERQNKRFYGDSGIIGYISTSGQLCIPVYRQEDIVAAENVRSVVGDFSNALFIKEDDTLWSLGEKEPVKISENAENIYLNDDSAFILKNDKTLWRLDVNSFEQFEILRDVAKFYLFKDNDFCFAVKTNGELLALENNAPRTIFHNAIDAFSVGTNKIGIVTNENKLFLWENSQKQESEPKAVFENFDLRFVTEKNDELFFIDTGDVLWRAGNASDEPEMIKENVKAVGFGAWKGLVIAITNDLEAYCLKNGELEKAADVPVIEIVDGGHYCVGVEDDSSSGMLLEIRRDGRIEPFGSVRFALN